MDDALARAATRPGCRGRLSVAAALVLALGVGAVLRMDAAGPGPQPASAELCVVAPAQPWDAASGLPPDAPRPVPANARCPVCGMFPSRNLRWAAQVIYADGAAHFFDSPLTLHLFLQDVPRYAAGRTGADVASRWVTDLETGRWIDADRAFHVQGSDTPGPMRAGNLPAFATADAAQRHADAHGGRVLRAAAIDPALVRALDGRSHRAR